MNSESSLLESLREKELIIFGLGREGWSTYSFLRKQFPEKKIILSDDRSLEELVGKKKDGEKGGNGGENGEKGGNGGENGEKGGNGGEREKKWRHALEHPQTEFITEIKPTANSVIFKAPGVPPDHSLLKKATAIGTQLSSNTQLFFKLVTVRNCTWLTSTVANCKRQLRTVIIGVTGTKGKSTTASLIHHVLTKGGLNSFLGGNIGQPALDTYQAWCQTQSSPQLTHFVLELSSHQLANLDTSPHLAVIQTIFSEHLDYYDSFDQYFQAKTNITRYQTEHDQVVFNTDSQTARQLAELSPGQKTPFSVNHNSDSSLLKLAKNCPLLGHHNLYNIMPSIIIARQLGLDDHQISSALQSFKPLPHRLQLIATIDGVKYVDDSIATNPPAAIAGLQAFEDQPIILLAGGYERQQDFSQLAQQIKKSQVKAIALFPPTGNRLLAELEKIEISNKLRDKIEEFSTMKEAVYHAQQHAKPGDVVLLSPGAASFGLFKNYKDRGKQFEAEVLAQQNA